MTNTYELVGLSKETPARIPKPVELISELVDYRVEGSSVILTCDSRLYRPTTHNYYGTRCEVVFDEPKEGAVYAVQLDFCTPGIMRVRIYPGDEVPLHQTPMVVGQFDEEVPITCQEEDQHLLIETSAMQVEVVREPWQLIVRDRQGRRVWATKPVDIQPLRRPEMQWNPPQERWLFMHRYAYPAGMQRADQARVFASFELDHDEHLYGLGEDFGRLDKRNIQRQLWIQEGFGNASPASYKQTPFYMSSKGYGLFVNTSNAIAFNMGSHEHTAVTFMVEDADLIDFYFIYGPSFKEILPGYTRITGQPGIPPEWSFGLWMGRITYDSQEQVEDVARSLRAHQIPCDVIHVDTGWYEKEWVCDLEFSKARFPDPKKMTDWLHEQGFHLCLWQLPLLVIDSKMYFEAAENGYLVRRGNGMPYLSSGFLSDAGLIDYSNPEAVDWIKEKFKALFEQGVDVIKADFGEGTPPDGEFHGYPGTEMHNLYPLLYNKAVFEATEEFYGKGNAMIWGRSGWAGSQRYPVHWSGDGIGRFEDLACVVRSALNFGLSGFPFYSHDVGGFSGLPSPELYVRWIQLGAFSSHVRCHGQPPREPWEYGSEAEDLFRRVMTLRYRLMPYIYTEAKFAAETSQPMMRALVLDYQDDPTVFTIEDQYLFGRSLLVAPIMNEEGRRKVYLPQGEWIDYWDHTRVMGPVWLDIEAPLEEIPLYVRAGAILPYGPEQQYVGEHPDDPLTLEVYAPDGDGQFIINHTDGQQTEVAYHCEADMVSVDTGQAPGEVILNLVGVAAASAELADGTPLALIEIEPACWQVRYDGRTPQKVVFAIK